MRVYRESLDETLKFVRHEFPNLQLEVTAPRQLHVYVEMVDVLGTYETLHE